MTTMRAMTIEEAEEFGPRITCESCGFVLLPAAPGETVCSVCWSRRYLACVACDAPATETCEAGRVCGAHFEEWAEAQSEPDMREFDIPRPWEV